VATLNWLSDPDRNLLVNPVLRAGCAVWLEGTSYDLNDPPSREFELGSVWSPNMAFLRRLVGRSEYEYLTTVDRALCRR
jgi:hypothetical protein